MGSGMQDLHERFAAELVRRIVARMQAILSEPLSKKMIPLESPALSSIDSRSSEMTVRTVEAVNEAETHISINSSDSETTVRPDRREYGTHESRLKVGSPLGSATQEPVLFEPINNRRDERHGLVKADASHDNNTDASSGDDQPWQTVR
jgi:hypothetical protein